MTSDFMEVARLTNELNGAPDQAMVEVPHPFQMLSDEELRALADRITDKLIAAVTVQAGE